MSEGHHLHRLEPTAITGCGAVSPLGVGVAALWAAIEEGRDGIRPILRFSTGRAGVHLAALVPGYDGPIAQDEGVAAYELSRRLAILAGREAMAVASLDPGPRSDLRVGLVLGASLLDASRSAFELAKEVGDELGISGPRISVSTACASSTNAVGLARDLLDSNDCDVVLAGGTDVVSSTLFFGFHALGVLAISKCAPFGRSTGTTLGEGAGLVVLERLGAAARRGVKPQAILLGYGLSGDAYHETSPDPTGSGVARALKSALRDARVEPSAIGYANVHGTGTESNDLAEARAYRDVFADANACLPLSASKSFLGHAQAAAGILELIVTILALQRQVVPPTLHVTETRPGAPSDVVRGTRPRAHRFDTAIKSSSAFGGANAALIVARPESDAAKIERRVATQPLWIRGIGASGGEHSAEDSEAHKLVRSVDMRTFDPSSRLLTLAVASALRDGALPLRGAVGDRLGLVVGLTHPSPESVDRFQKSTELRGVEAPSVSAFARLVLNATTGSCAMALSIRGLQSTITTGPGSGLAALVYAAQLLAARSDTLAVVAGAVDEREKGEGGQGATAILLGTEPAEGGVPLRLSGWAFGPAGEPGAAAALAVARAGLDLSQVETWRPPAAPYLESSAELAAVAAAATALRGRDREHVLITATGGTASAAVVLSRGDTSAS